MQKTYKEAYEDYHDLHNGETCFIIGNGKSLANESNEFLRSYTSFGTNRIYKKFIPDYYVCINELVARQYKEEISMINSVKFVTEKVQMGGVIPIKSNYVMGFSKEPWKSISEGNTVTYVCLQLAYWMGFQTVLLVGVDHYYKYNGYPHEVLLAEGEDPNHFDPTYFTGGVLWNAPDLKGSEDAYRLAKRVYEKDGRNIINITKGSLLDVFEKEEEYGE